MSSKSLPGFVKVKPYIYLYQPPSPTSTNVPSKSSSTDPQTVLLFTWLLASLRNIAKYTEGYKILFPNARIIVVTAGYGELYRFITTVQERMKPAIRLACGPPTAPDAATNDKRLLVQNLSNGGLRNLEGALRAYKEIYGRPMAPPVMIHDSTPSNPAVGVQIERGAAMFKHTLPKFWPLKWLMHYTYVFAMVVLYAVPEWVGIEGMLPFMRREMADPKLLSTKTKKLYIFGKGDELVDWESVVGHAEMARSNGFEDVQMEEFVGSGHVGHLKVDPVRYWKIVKGLWERGVKAQL